MSVPIYHFNKLVLALCLLATGCAIEPFPIATSTQSVTKNYQLVSETRLGNASFASEYYGKDVESNVTFMILFPQSAVWVPSSYRTTKWVIVQAGDVGLVIPKTAPCIDGVIEAQPGTRIHVWGTVIEPAAGMVGSAIVVDKCELGAAPKAPSFPAQ